MAYEEIQSGLSAEEARRKRLRQQIIESLGGMGETQMVSGRAVPFSPVTGLSKIAQALMLKQGLGGSEEETQRLMEQQTGEREGAIQDVMDIYRGTPATTTSESPQMMPGQMENQELWANEPQVTTPAVAGDPTLAALTAASSPYTEDMSSILSKQGGGGGATPYFKPVYGKSGEILSYDTRTGKAAPTEYIAAQYDPETMGAVKGGQAQAQKDVELAMNPQIASAVDLAEREAEKTIVRPKIESGLEAGLAKTKMLDNTIDQAIDQSGIWTSGFLGAMTSWVPGSPGYDLAKTLDTVRSNIGFDKLQEMRENSPTGGALGQVSERENELLQSVWSSVEQAQSPEQLKENLEKVRQQVKESWSRVRDAYEKEYGEPFEGRQQPQTGGFDEEKERRYQEWKARQ